MIFYSSHNDIPDSVKGGVVAVGNFDGLHLGHRSLIAAARAEATRLCAPLVVLTFEPHPREVFCPQAEPFRLTLLPAKQRLFADMGVDVLIAAAFTPAFAAMNADVFIRDVLVQALGTRHIVVGEDFTFGQGRTGTADTLKRAKTEGLFGLTLISPLRGAGQDVLSSTLIRDLVRRGALDEAAERMGQPFEMEGEVIHGDGRGRTIGTPTANQHVPRMIRPPFGIYAVRVLIEGEKALRDGVANYGTRPMFAVREPLLETHIFDFDSDIYGQTLRVRPVRFLRPEMTFEGLFALKAQIERDCAAARACLQSEPPQDRAGL